MGEKAPGRDRRTFIGVSKGDHDNPARFDEALQSVADKMTDVGFVSRDEGPLWFEITSIHVEIENQNVRTFSVGVTGPVH